MENARKTVDKQNDDGFWFLKLEVSVKSIIIVAEKYTLPSQEWNHQKGKKGKYLDCSCSLVVLVVLLLSFFFQKGQNHRACLLPNKYGKNCFVDENKTRTVVETGRLYLDGHVARSLWQFRWFASKE